jgi:anti-anti-sigma factor
MATITPRRHDEAAEPDRLVELGALTLRVEDEGDVCALSLYGELDASSAEMFAHEVEHACDDADAVIVDLSGLDFMDSTALATLGALVAEDGADGNRLRLLRGCGQVQSLMELSGIDRMLPFID